MSYVCDGLRRVFETHGATPVAPPTIRPKPPPSLAAPPAASKGLVRLLDHKGAVVVLPGNLTAPFARFVARSGVTRLKRYQIDRIFLAAGPERSCTEAWEADFDIISSSSASASPSTPFYGAGYSAAVIGKGLGSKADAALDGARGGGGGGGGHFEVAEAEAVLVMSQVCMHMHGHLRQRLERVMWVDGGLRVSRSGLCRSSSCGFPSRRRGSSSLSRSLS